MPKDAVRTLEATETSRVARELDPRRNGWLIANAERTDVTVLEASGAIVGIDAAGCARVADPSRSEGAKALGHVTAHVDLREVSGPAGTASAFLEGRGDTSCWRCTFTSIEMALAKPTHEPTVAGELRRASGSRPWADWLAAFTTEAFPAGGTPPAVPRDRLWAWYDADQPRSMAGALDLGGVVVRIVTVFTPVEFRGRGYAGALVGRLAEQLRSAGVPNVTLNVDVFNPTAIRVYERAGFVPVSRSETWRRLVTPG